MEALQWHLSQDLHGLHADFQMLIHLLAVEVRRHARQFQLTMQRLV